MDYNKLSKRLMKTVIITLVALPILAAVSIFININYIDPKTGFCIDDSIVPMIYNWISVALIIAAFIVSRGFAIPFVSAGKSKAGKQNAHDAGNDAQEDIAPADAPEEEAESVPDEEEAELLPDAASVDAKKSAKIPPAPPTDGASLVIVTNNSGLIFATALLGFMYIATFLLLAIRLMASSSADAISSAVLIVSVLCGMYFIVISAKNLNPHSPVYGFFALMPVVWSALRFVMYFIGLHNNVNLGTSFFALMTPCVMMFFFMSEAKFTLRNKSVYSFQSYIFTAICVCLFVTLYSAPNIMLAAFWITGFSNETFFSLIELSIGIYVMTKLFIIAAKLRDFKTDIEAQECPEKQA